MDPVTKTLRDIAAEEQRAIDARVRGADEGELVDATQLVIDEYYNGDRERAVDWMRKAVAANKEPEHG